MKCFHHNDLDGRCAGAVVNLFMEEECAFIEMDYTKSFPLDMISKDELIYILDFHVQNVKEFLDLQEITTNIVLIDHHKSTIEHQQNNPDLYVNLKECILDESRSGCWLTWNYFENLPPPKAIELIDDMDRWVWAFDETQNFTIGIKLYSHQPVDDVWRELLIPIDCGDLGSLEASNDYVLEICAQGKICSQYDDMISNDYCLSYGFETELEGHKAFAQGMYRGGSKTFGDRIKGYPLLLSFEFTGEKYIIGLYSETIDVSEIAVRHGGGGHKGAAGFTCDELPFKKV